MAKPKDKSVMTMANKHHSDIVTESPPSLGTGSSLRAADGHNVDGWADEDIRIYNELLSERAKLEKEKNELEQKSTRHHTQRALLDENSTTLDGMFKAQFGGEFKFTGGGSCCLDADLGNLCAEGSKELNSPCGHEICTRAKTKGISWVEMDTIKNYHARIMSEKSQRKRNALRKQRDVELIRVKKEDEEELAWRMRRAAISDKALGTSSELPPLMPGESTNAVIPASLDTVASRHVLLDPRNSAILEAAKENEHVVRRIRGRLDRIRHDVNAGRVSPADARVSLDQANFEMAEAERKNNEFRQLIVDAEPALPHVHQPANLSSSSLSQLLQSTSATSTSDTFSNALSLMRGFFTTSDPQEVQAAIGELRRVLELTGPMDPILQKSFLALTEMVVKSPGRSHNADVAANDRRAQACHDFVNVMMALRQNMQTSKESPSGISSHGMDVDEETVKANFECVKVEEAARKDMEKIADRMADDTVENVTATLKKVKTKALLKSPIPPLSDLVLDDVINDILFQRSVRALVAEAAGPVSLSSVSGKLTSLVINQARKDPDKYVAALDVVIESIEKTLKTQGKEPSAILSEAIAKVEDSIPKFVAAHEEKLKKGAVNKHAPPSTSAVTSAIEFISASGKNVSFAKYLLTGELVDKESWNAFRNFFSSRTVHDAVTVRDRVIAHYHKHRDEGIWDIFRVVANHHTRDSFRFEPWATEKELYRANMAVAAVGQEKLLDVIMAYQKRGVCPGMAAIVVSHRLTYQVREDFDVAKASTMQLRAIFEHYDPPHHRDWFQSFNFIAQAMLDLFAVMIFQAKGLDHKEVPILASDVVGIVCTFVLAAESPTSAITNLHVLQAFISNTLVYNNTPGEIGKLQGVLLRFLRMCEDPRYRCLPEHRCRAHLTALNNEKYKTLIPAPLNVNKPTQPTSLSLNKPPPQTPTSTIEYLKQRLANQPAERLVPIRIYLQCVRDWETATLLAPHLTCQQTGRPCTCSVAAKEAAHDFLIRKSVLDAGFEELKTYLKMNADPPKSLWARLDEEAQLFRAITLRRAKEVERESEVKTAQVKSRFAEHLGHDPKAREPSNTQPIKLKQVTVNVPRIQNSLSSGLSETGNFDRAQSGDSAINQSGKKMDSSSRASGSQADTKSDQPPQPPTAAASNKAYLSVAELTIMNQLIKFYDGLVKVEQTSADLTGFTQQNTLNGILKQLHELAAGHMAMAWIIAEGQGYVGLQAWINGNSVGVDSEMPWPKADDDDNLTPVKNTSNAVKGKEKSLEETEDQDQLSTVSQASTASPAPLSEHESHQVATSTDITGENSSAHKQTGSQRRRRRPKHKR